MNELKLKAMKYLHEKMLQLQPTANELNVSETEVVVHEANLAPIPIFFHPCILCCLFFIVLLLAI